MLTLEQYRAAESLEQYLGDPADPRSRISFAAALELDEREAYPFEQHAALDSFHLAEFYIPAAHGGRGTSLEEIFALLRVLSRRDLSVAISHVITFLGALPIWIAGSLEQRQTVAALIRERHKIAFGLTERAHGGDLLANELEAQQEDGRIVITGEKWSIGNATKATAIVLLARTKPEGGARGFSFLFADKRELDPTQFSHLPKMQTVGLRGADLRGVRFERCNVPVAARVGPAGTGFELALKTLQITRIMSTGLSLGAAGTALRLTLDYALSERRYGETVFSIPHVRDTLCSAFLDLMICDCVAISAVRALHVCPEQASVWSAVVKYFVPATIESVFRDLAVILGGASFLRAGHPWSMFQKMARDSSIVSVFEGSSVVQLYALGLQLDQLVASGPADDTAMSVIETVFSLQANLPSFDPAGLDLFSRGRNHAVAALPLLGKQLESVGAAEPVTKAAQSISFEHDRLATDIKNARDAHARSRARLQLARRYTRVHAAASCIGFWIHNREILGEFFCRDAWLARCLNRLIAEDSDVVQEAGVERELLERFRHRSLFSVVPFETASWEKNDTCE